MQFLIITAAFAALVLMYTTLVGASFAIPNNIANAIGGLGNLVGNASYFLPVTDIIGAVGFVVAVYNWRIMIRIFIWVVKKLPYIGG